MKPPKIRDYPKEVIIRGEIWQVRFVRKMPKGDEGTKEEPTLGLNDPSERIIYIRLKQGREETFKTFIHEFIHAIEAEWDFDLPHDMVDMLENGLYQGLRDNWSRFMVTPTKPAED